MNLRTDSVCSLLSTHRIVFLGLIDFPDFFATQATSRPWTHCGCGRPAAIMGWPHPGPGPGPPKMEMRGPSRIAKRHKNRAAMCLRVTAIQARAGMRRTSGPCTVACPLNASRRFLGMLPGRWPDCASEPRTARSLSFKLWVIRRKLRFVFIETLAKSTNSRSACKWRMSGEEMTHFGPRFHDFCSSLRKS